MSSPVVIPPQPHLAPHQQRVVIEFNALNEKIYNLNKFFSTPQYAHLDGEERRDLNEQRICMVLYSDILLKRLSRWGVRP